MKGRAVIVDGVKYESVRKVPAAHADIKANGLAQALYALQTTYKGHAIAFADEVEAVIEAWKPAREPINPKLHTPGTRLLEYGYVTHRLGTYRGERV
jgi:hypothetical protein